MAINDPRIYDYSSADLQASVAAATNAINAHLQTYTSGPKVADALHAARALNDFCTALRSLPNTMAITVTGAYDALSGALQPDYAAIPTAVRDHVVALRAAFANLIGYSLGRAIEYHDELRRYLVALA